MSRADLDAGLAEALDALDGWARSDACDADERAREARGRVLLAVDAIVAAAETARDSAALAWLDTLASRARAANRGERGSEYGDGKVDAYERAADDIRDGAHVAFRGEL